MEVEVNGGGGGEGRGRGRGAQERVSVNVVEVVAGWVGQEWDKSGVGIRARVKLAVKRQRWG